MLLIFPYLCGVTDCHVASLLAMTSINLPRFTTSATEHPQFYQALYSYLRIFLLFSNIICQGRARCFLLSAGAVIRQSTAFGGYPRYTTNGEAAESAVSPRAYGGGKNLSGLPVFQRCREHGSCALPAAKAAMARYAQIKICFGTSDGERRHRPHFILLDTVSGVQQWQRSGRKRFFSKCRCKRTKNDVK